MTRIVIAALAAAAAPLALPSQALAAWTWPLPGEVVTGYRNGADPYAGGQHRGIDIAGDVGDVVVAAVPGLVRFAGTAGSSGSTVSVRSADGRFDVSYLHLGSIAVEPGRRVAAGDPIGGVGTTGVRSVARPHLHFGVRRAGSRHAYLDPLALLPAPPAAPAPRTPDPVGAPVPRAAPVPVRPAPRAARPAPSPGAAPEPWRLPAPRGLSVRTARPDRLREPAVGSTAPEPGAEAETPALRRRDALPHADAGRQRHLGAAPPARRLPAGELAPAPRTAPRPGGGVDAGRLLACAGLLATALALSAKRPGRTASMRAPTAILSRLVPRPRE